MDLGRACLECAVADAHLQTRKNQKDSEGSERTKKGLGRSQERMSMRTSHNGASLVAHCQGEAPFG